MVPVLRRIADGSTRRAKALALAGHAYLGRYQEAVWLIGDGRSGTTWVSSLINHRRHYREMFEPFHPRVLGGGLVLNRYLRPDEEDEAFREVAARVFSGRLTHPRVDADAPVALYRGLLIKDIFANLFACWAGRRFPQLRIVLLLRHPFAVAASKLHKRKWLWTVDPMDLLNQRDLYEDYLRPHEALIRDVSAGGDYIAKQVLIWAILNYVPLLQFRAAQSRDQLRVVFYEDLCARPDEEVSRVLRHIRRRGGDDSVAIDARIVARPSRVTHSASALKTGASPVDSWSRELTPAQIDQGLATLAAFGLDALYSADPMPRHGGLAAMRPSAAL
jgi:hypothetical protein